MRLIEHALSDEPRANIVINSVALEFGIPTLDIQAGHERGSQNTVMARQVAIYLFHTVFDMNMTRAGRAFHRHATTAKHACAVVEDCRDDPVLNARILRLESFLRQTPLPKAYG